MSENEGPSESPQDSPQENPNPDENLPALPEGATPGEDIKTTLKRFRGKQAALAELLLDQLLSGKAKRGGRRFDTADVELARMGMDAMHNLALDDADSETLLRAARLKKKVEEMEKVLAKEEPAPATSMTEEELVEFRENLAKHGLTMEDLDL